MFHKLSFKRNAQHLNQIPCAPLYSNWQLPSGDSWSLITQLNWLSTYKYKRHRSAICLSAYLAVEGSDHYYLVTEPGNHSSIPPVTLIENMTYCFNEDLSAYIRLTNQEDQKGHCLKIWTQSIEFEKLFWSLPFLTKEIEDQNHILSSFNIHLWSSHEGFGKMSIWFWMRLDFWFTSFIYRSVKLFCHLDL